MRTKLKAIWKILTKKAWIVGYVSDQSVWTALHMTTEEMKDFSNNLVAVCRQEIVQAEAVKEAQAIADGDDN